MTSGCSEGRRQAVIGMPVVRMPVVLETLGVLGAWALLGLLVAPIVLRRMARRESGSAVAARRGQAQQQAR